MKKTLTDKILAAIETYDQVMTCEKGTPQEQEARCVEAAHECINSIRLIIEEDVPPANLNNPIARLHEHAQARAATVPQYTFSSSGPDHTPRFTCVCEYLSFRAEAFAGSKQGAKRKAATAVLAQVVAGTRRVAS